MNYLNRRQLLLAGLGVAGGGLSACAAPSEPATPGAPPSSAPPPSISRTPALSPAPGGSTVESVLRPRPVTLDLGGVTAKTWAYDDSGATVLRGTAGDLFRINVENQLPTSTSVHWHGIRLHNAADGVPGVTQQPIEPGTTFNYEFVAPDPGTYFFHPHSGVQLDRGLYAPLIIDDPAEPGDYDDEWIVVLDDWTDGVGRSPDEIFEEFAAKDGSVSMGMGHGNMGDMGHGSGSALGDAGDVAYPHYLINGRVPDAPASFDGEPGQRVRLRMINAGSDTIFKIALGGHTMTVTHSDGFPVEPRDTASLYIAMGERYDATVTLGDGAFPLVARPEGKQGLALAVVRTASGTAPTAETPVPELDGDALLGTQLRAADGSRLTDGDVDLSFGVELNGQMDPYGWGINGRKFGDHEPLEVAANNRVRMRMTNMTMMAHPMHIHGHTWGLPDSGGLRKDTVLLTPMQTLELDLIADNPGEWMLHCHNIYHAEVGMMTSMRYL
ncbi:multicopper oxidase family protein [Tessaracoccus sp. OS52]|uniref:multicopper oxidase family protein n=1 Tax=Tessaracoccus sp. OS52 TaxID=2886691 RepID=UPI001D10782E|nr:multicopper oxidase family protein [Tessaracoccus sp. OS52]MCC2592492.1 multicopper oxidase family protein [Tessaracoccus sp. OS52]